MMGEDWIPQPVRAWVYRTLTVVLGINAIFGVIPDGVISKVIAVASVFGFGLAAAHTPTKGY